MADVGFYDQNGAHLKENSRFKFKTFGFLIEAKITEFVPSFDGELGMAGMRLKIKMIG